MGLWRVKSWDGWGDLRFGVAHQLNELTWCPITVTDDHCGNGAALFETVAFSRTRDSNYHSQSSQIRGQTVSKSPWDEPEQRASRAMWDTEWLPPLRPNRAITSRRLAGLAAQLHCSLRLRIMATASSASPQQSTSLRRIYLQHTGARISSCL